jgi:tetratricopeptide (TPR) repeat protein
MVSGITAAVLDRRIRQIRTRLRLTQDDLAGGDYSKSYISAIEQGKTRPSLSALQRICTRLDVSPGILLDPNAEGFSPYDPDALSRRVRRKRGSRAGYGPGDASQLEYSLAMAELQIYTGSAEPALETLRALLSSEAPREGRARSHTTDPTLKARILYLAALAAVRAGDPASALDYAGQAIEAAQAAGDRTAVERLRNLQGRAHYMNDQPLTALEYHRRCWEAISTGQIRDPNLKLQVYYNLAADYWALHDNEHARATYRDALDLVNEVNNFSAQGKASAAQAGHLGGLHLYTLAAPLAIRAAGIHEALDNIQLVARIENRYGDLLADMGDIEGAETYIDRSLQLAETVNSDVDKAVALTNLARFALKQGNLDQADSHARQAVSLLRNYRLTGVTSNKARKAAGPMRTENARILSKALAVAADIATERGDSAQADSMFGEAINVLEGSSSPGGSEIYQRYAQILASRGDHEQASHYYELAYHAVTNRPR